MRSWMAEYERKKTTAEKAVRVVKSGDRVVLSHACGEPRVLPGELVKRAGELRDVQIVHQVAMGEAQLAKKAFEIYNVKI